MKIDGLVAQIISAANFDNFTTGDVRSFYITLKNDPTLQPATTRRKIYAELLKLVKKGWLKKKKSTTNKFTRFSKTDLFDTAKLVSKEGAVDRSAKKSNAKTHKNLLEKLNHYKAELLLNIGETEAYKEVYAEFPELIDQIQPQYNIARDNNTKILGKIRAIEGLMKHDEST